MSKLPDIATQQEHRATLRKTLRNHPDNERIRNALKKSVRPQFVQQAAQQGIFICYAMQDGIFALDLALKLREAVIRAFLDELDADETTDWGDTVNQALRDCAVMLMVVSPASLEDGEVKAEYIYFMNTGKIIVPVIAEPCDTSALDTMVKPIDFTTNSKIALQKLKALLIAQ